MLYRALVLIFAFELMFWSALAQERVPDEPAEEQGAQQSAPEEATPDPTLSTGIPVTTADLPDIAGGKDPSGNRPDREAAGSEREKAQAYLFFGEHPSQWVIAITGALSVAVSILAVCLLKATLRETARAVKVAEDANAVTASTFAAQLSPVFVIEFDEESEKAWADSHFKSGLKFKVRNVGQGVGIMMRLCRHWERRHSGALPDAIAPVSPPEGSVDRVNEIAIGPGHLSYPIKASVSLIQRGDDFEAAIQSRTLRLYFIGFMEYIDLSGKRYRSGFCFLRNMNDEYIGLHVPWPTDGTASQHNYHHALNDAGRPIASTGGSGSSPAPHGTVATFPG